MFFVKNNIGKALNDGFLIKSNMDEVLNARKENWSVET
jgi:hypothetical protein